MTSTYAGLGPGKILMLIATHALIAFGAFSLGTMRNEPATAPVEDPPTEMDSDLKSGVTGIGGVFFYSDDPGATRDWYETHLGIVSLDWGGLPFMWRESDQPEETGYTVWAPFATSSDHFAPGSHNVMINYRVSNLTDLMESMREAGVEIVGEIQQAENGKFAWILDLEGRKVELWEPVPSAEDPYL